MSIVPSMLRHAVLASLTLAYPVVVYWSLGHVEPRWLALPLVALTFVRWSTARQPVWRMTALLTLPLAGGTLLANAVLPLKLYPMLVSAVFGALFGWSLVHPPSAAERLARLSRPDLPPAGVAYTRKVTWVWLGFFVVNGLLAAATALWASDAVWALYNGLVAYGVMGVLFAGEWLVRQRVMANHG